MDEIRDILKKYNENYINNGLSSLDNLNQYAGTFYKDVADIYDCITRIKNTTRNPTGFSQSDAPILGLLVRVWKLLKEIIKYHEQNNAEIISILERPLLESSITATYLLQNDENVIEDYRKCSYKDRLRILKDYKAGSEFFDTKPGKRLLKSIMDKMNSENLDENSFGIQKRNNWKLQGKSFFEIFKDVTNEKLYRYTFGMMSESIHCSWNESMDYCLQKNEDGTYSIFPFYQEADIRYVTPILYFCNQAYKLWLQRIDVNSEYLNKTLNWIEKTNNMLFIRFDELYVQ